MGDQWSFGGVEFSQTGAVLVVDLSSVHGMPAVRGDNPEIPLREGRLHAEKLFDQRVLTLGVYLEGRSIAEFEQRLTAFQTVCGRRNRQTLVRTLADRSQRSTLAEVIKFDPKPDSPVTAKITIDFLMAEPFFRSVQQVNQLVAVNANPTLFSLGNGGSVTDKTALITMTGPLSFPKLTNLTTGVWVGYNGNVAVGNVVTIDTAAMTCLLDTGNRLDVLTHSGDAYFMTLAPGNNDMKLESPTTGGSVRVQFYPPFL